MPEKIVSGIYALCLKPDAFHNAELLLIRHRLTLLAVARAGPRNAPALVILRKTPIPRVARAHPRLALFDAIPPTLLEMPRRKPFKSEVCVLKT